MADQIEGRWFHVHGVDDPKPCYGGGLNQGLADDLAAVHCDDGLPAEIVENDIPIRLCPNRQIGWVSLVGRVRG